MEGSSLFIASVPQCGGVSPMGAFIQGGKSERLRKEKLSVLFAPALEGVGAAQGELPSGNQRFVGLSAGQGAAAGGEWGKQGERDPNGEQGSSGTASIVQSFRSCSHDPATHRNSPTRHKVDGRPHPSWLGFRGVHDNPSIDSIDLIYFSIVERVSTCNKTERGNASLEGSQDKLASTS